MDRWNGRVALVTGASAGIGNAIAKTLSKSGMKVVACARRLDKLESLADWTKSEGYPGKLFPVKCDLANVDDIKQMFEFIEGNPELTKVDVCISNAGLGYLKGLKDLTPEEMHTMMDVNLIAPTFVTQLAVKLMLKTGVKDGHILFVSSTAAHFNFDSTAIGFYSATKQALKCLMEFWRKELREIGDNSIRIGAVSPGLTQTEAHAISFGSEQAAKDFYAASTYLEAQDVADTIVSLLAAKPHVQIHDVMVRHTQEKIGL